MLQWFGIFLVLGLLWRVHERVGRVERRVEVLEGRFRDYTVGF